jgi:hypothetical protein
MSTHKLPTEDYLALEQLLIAQLQRLRALRTVMGHRSLRAIRDSNGDVQTPCAAISYLGDAPGSPPQTQSSLGTVCTVKQRWLVTLIVEDATNLDTGDEQRRVIGPLVAQVLHVLQGWKPGAGFGNLHRSAQTVAPESDERFYMFPIVFESQITFKSNQNV